MLLSNNESLSEKWANIITHGVGTILSCSALIYFIVTINNYGSFYLKTGILIFGSTLIFVYLSSTLYHIADVYYPKRINMFRKIDHISIYTLIAGTQTPFIILYLNNQIASKYLLILWFLVLMGVFYKIFWMGKYTKLSIITYLGLGWLVLLVIPQMLEHMHANVFYWIIFGGIAYSSGVIFYLKRRIKFNHAIWHMFVLAGSLGHFIALCLALNG